MAGWPSNEPGNYFALGKQSAKTSEVNPEFFFLHLNGTGIDKKDQIKSEREGGAGQEVSLRYRTSVDSQGQVVANLRPETGHRLFAWALGGNTVATYAVASGVNLNDHTLFPQSSMPYLTGEQYFTDEVERFIDVLVTDLSVQGQAGEPIKCTAKIMGGGTAYQKDVASILTPAREANRPFFYSQASITIDGVGSYNTKVSKFKLDINRHVDDKIITVGLNREDVVPLAFDCKLDFTLKYENRTLYQKIEYGIGGSQVPFDLSTSTFDLAMPSGSYTFRVNVPFMHLTGAKINPMLDPDGKTVYLDVTAETIKNATYAVFAVARTGTTALQV